MEFKKGDLVRVARKINVEKGWDNGWTHSMDEFVNDGYEYVVQGVSEMGVNIIFGKHNYKFPPSSLELVESKEEQPDPGRHYRHSIKVKLTEQDKENGFVMVQLDPAQIAEAYKGMSGMRFTILKKVLRCGSGGKPYEQDLLDIISAAQRELELSK